MAKGGRKPRQVQSWAGIGIGVVAIALVLVLILVGRDSDGGIGSNCSRPLPRLLQVELDDTEFNSAVLTLDQIALVAEAGNLPAAEEAFFGGVHDFTHTLDAGLREEQPDIARSLCEDVLEIESGLIGGDPDEVAELARRIVGIVRTVAPDFGVTLVN